MSSEDLLSCVGVSRNDVFDLRLINGLLVIKADQVTSVAHGS
jgi:hypothetical protein